MYIFTPCNISYKRRVRTLLAALSFLCVLPLCAQNAGGAVSPAERLFAFFKKASRFDYDFPREKVYLHFDNSAYIEGDTIWYQAYVVRASTLRPVALSRVLYVELLNADGQLMEKQTLRVDSAGRADGSLCLNLPVRAGYYEVRAYTRAMTNWGASACFSRVFPVFTAENPQSDVDRRADISLARLSVPEPEAQKRATIGAPRPYLMQNAAGRQLDFYPEGGHRARGVDQQIAFKLTDGRGNPVADTLQVFDAGGRLCAEAVPEHEGMGSFVLPAGFADGYVVLKNVRKGAKARRYSLPAAVGAYALHARVTDEGLWVSVAANDSAVQAGGVLGLAAFSRENACFFDTLTAQPEPVEILIPRRALREGVNRVELFGSDGRSFASRMVWYGAEDALQRRRVRVEVEQNAKEYAPFVPAVVQMRLTDADERPVQATVSVAVRDEAGNIVANPAGGMAVEMLLASELRGYVHRPDLYFTENDARHRRMLDLLLMVQGWTANSFDTMCGADTFRLTQPIENKLIVRGTLYKENDKREPQPGMNLSFRAYSLVGHRIGGETRTDAQGRFAFESDVDFSGDFIAQFTSTDDKGKRKWGRLALDRWFAPNPRPLFAPELALVEPDTAVAGVPQRVPVTFEWKDTIPRTLPTVLGEADVKVRNKYRGFTGNRYTWRGGEKHGMRRATKFYNIEQECEHVKDLGMQPGDLPHLLGLLEKDFEYSRYETVDMALAHMAGFAQDGGTSAAAQTGVEPELSTAERAYGGKFLQPDWTYHGLPIEVYFNNEPFSDLAGRFPELYTDISAEEIKSVSIVFENRRTDAVTGKTKRYSSEKYKMYVYEIPDKYRYDNRKGVEKRRIQGFASKTQFYAPNYRSFDLPTDRDMRRTLHWAPAVTTDAAGRAHLIFFTNARAGQRLDISIRGITPDGRMVDYDTH